MYSNNVQAMYAITVVNVACLIPTSIKGRRLPMSLSMPAVIPTQQIWMKVYHAASAGSCPAHELHECLSGLQDDRHCRLATRPTDASDRALRARSPTTGQHTALSCVQQCTLHRRDWSFTHRIMPCAHPCTVSTPNKELELLSNLTFIDGRPKHSMPLQSSSQVAQQ